jgi:hypothetical protein
MNSLKKGGNSVHDCIELLQKIQQLNYLLSSMKKELKKEIT